MGTSLQGDNFKTLILSDQQSKIQYLICNDIKLRQAVNPHIWEAGSTEYLAFCPVKGPKRERL